MQSYFKKWTIQRILQLLVGIYFIWNYIEDKMIFSLLFGGVMLLQAVLNIGCFSSKGCTVPQNKNYETENDEGIDFEEVK